MTGDVSSFLTTFTRCDGQPVIFRLFSRNICYDLNEKKNFEGTVVETLSFVSRHTKNDFLFFFYFSDFVSLISLLTKNKSKNNENALDSYGRARPDHSGQ